MHEDKKTEIISIQHNSSFIDTMDYQVSPLLSYTRSTKTICLKLSADSSFA